MHQNCKFKANSIERGRVGEEDAQGLRVRRRSGVGEGARKQMAHIEVGGPRFTFGSIFASGHIGRPSLDALSIECDQV